MTALKGARVRPFVGYNFFNPKALNNLMSTTAQALNINTKYRIGGGPSFGLSAEYPLNFVSKYIHAGLRLDYFTSSSSAVTVGEGTKSATLESSLSGVPVMATLGVVYPVLKQVQVGGVLAAGVPVFYRFTTEVSGSGVPQQMPNGTITYEANPFTALVSGFGEYLFTDHIGLRLEAGYRFISSDQMKASESYGTIKEGTLLRDQNNANVKVDASSFNSAVSLVVTI